MSELPKLDLQPHDLPKAIQTYLDYWSNQAKFFYPASIPDEKQNAQKILDFLSSDSQTSRLFTRENLSGHFTASAFIINNEFNKVLLAHHKKLDKWLQLGGHADGEQDLRIVALTEAQEESGLNDFLFWSPETITHTPSSFIFDIDVHQLPEHKGVPAHLHYDVRFLMIADDKQKLTCSDESNQLAWFDLNAAADASKEKSVHRPLLKVDWLSSTQNYLQPPKSFSNQDVRS